MKISEFMSCFDFSKTPRKYKESNFNQNTTSIKELYVHQNKKSYNEVIKKIKL